MPCRYSPVKGSMKPAGLLSAWEPHSPFPLLVWTDYRCHLTSVMPSQQRPAQKRLQLHHSSWNIFSIVTQTKPVTIAHRVTDGGTTPPNRKLQTNLSNLSIGVNHMFWVLVVYYRLCLNINLPSSCGSVFSWLFFSNWAKTTVAGSTWEKKMK